MPAIVTSRACCRACGGGRLGHLLPGDGMVAAHVDDALAGHGVATLGTQSYWLLHSQRRAPSIGIYGVSARGCSRGVCGACCNRWRPGACGRRAGALGGRRGQRKADSAGWRVACCERGDGFAAGLALVGTGGRVSRAARRAGAMGSVGGRASASGASGLEWHTAECWGDCRDPQMAGRGSTERRRAFDCAANEVGDEAGASQCLGRARRGG